MVRGDVRTKTRSPISKLWRRKAGIGRPVTHAYLQLAEQAAAEPAAALAASLAEKRAAAEAAEAAEQSASRGKALPRTITARTTGETSGGTAPSEDDYRAAGLKLLKERQRPARSADNLAPSTPKGPREAALFAFQVGHCLTYRLGGVS